MPKDRGALKKQRNVQEETVSENQAWLVLVVLWPVSAEQRLEPRSVGHWPGDTGAIISFRLHTQLSLLAVTTC